MHTQKKQLQEVTIRVPLPAVEDWGFEALVSLWEAHEDELRLRHLSCCGSHGTVLVETDQPLDTAVFAAVDYIDELRLVGHGPNRFEYLLETEAPRCQRSLDECEGEFFVRDGVTLSESGIEFTVVATREALRLFDVGDANSMEYEVLRVAGYSGHREPLESLTERQRTALETAYAKGYYEVPRRASSDELAADLDVEPSTVLEHLRRAERNVLTELLGAKNHRASPSRRDSPGSTGSRDRTEPPSKDSGRHAAPGEQVP